MCSPPLIFKSPPRPDYRIRKNIVSKNIRKSVSGFYKKEDIEDQLNLTKTELNKHISENTKLKTKNQI